MSSEQEKDALRIDRAIQDGSQGQPEDRPYLRMAKALRMHAASPESPMDQTVMRTQKEHLRQMAENFKNAKRMTHDARLSEHAESLNSAQDAERSRRAKRPWWFWTGALATAAIVVLVLFVSSTGNLPLKKLNMAANQAGLSRLSLVIPAANAADAFSLLVEKQGTGGAEVDTGFRVQSKVPVDQSALSQNLKVIKVSDQGESEVSYDLRSTGSGEYEVKPQQALDAGGVYRLVIATAVKDENGGLRQRDFSWAIQTKDVFKVIRAVPGDAVTGVPLDTSIEVMLSQTGWMDPATFFRIQPPTQGRFETHGRTLVFLPDKPLATSTLYTVTFKQGWGLAEGGPILDKDYTLRFQTASDQDLRDKGYLYAASYLAESAPGSEPVISLSSDDDRAPVEVTGYALEWDVAKNAIDEIEGQPAWLDAKDLRDRIISHAAGGQVFTLSAKIEETSDWSRAIRLSNSIGPGVYALQLKQGQRQPLWIILQVTDLAAYSMADRQQVLVWSVNTETGKPVEATVSADGQTVQTDAQGVAHLKTPDQWQDNQNQHGSDLPFMVLDLSQGASKLLTVLRQSRNPYFYGLDVSGGQAAYDHWSYLFADRPLYRSQDTINFFGLMQDRASGQGSGKVTVKLENFGLLDYGTYDDKVFAQTNLQTDAAGFLSGQLTWPGILSPGNYNLVMYQDGQQVLARTVEISDVTKPAYYLQLVPGRQSVFAGDRIDGQVMAKFYDGTPVVKARISLKAYGGFGADQAAEVTTDDLGYASFSFKTGVPKCDLEQAYVSCPARDILSLEARPALGEEGEIYAYSSVDVWRGSLWLGSAPLTTGGSDSEAEKNGQAVMHYRVRRVDLQQASGREEDSVLGEGVADISVRARVFEQHWDKIPDGTVYDPIAKQVVQRYRYQMRSVDIGSYQAQTEADGSVTFKFDMQDNLSYRVLVWIGDSAAQQAYTSYISKGWYDRSGDEAPALVPSSEHDQKNSYGLGEKVSVSFEQAGQKLPTERSSFLFVHASRGIQQAQLSPDGTHEFDFTDHDVPNMTVYGIAFLKHSFVMAQYDASYDSQDRQLNVVLEPGQTSYAPGGQATLHAKVTTKDGVPVSDAHVAVSITDEALLSVAQMDTTEAPLDTIYRWLPDGVVATAMTHGAEPWMGAGGGGAEMGGGGKTGAVRRNFKDQAGFLVMRTAADGTASGSFTLPDNITSWRMTAVAVSDDRRAGTARLSLPVTKPLFVEAVIPQAILASDKPVLKLRAYGTALPKSGSVTYAVDIPTLGIHQQTVTGEVGKAVYLALEHPVVGDHKATISVTLDGQVQDSVERMVRVVGTHATHDERVSVELAPGTELPDTGEAPEVQVIFESKTRAAARERIETLAQPWSARLEAIAAGRIAQSLLAGYYGVTTTDPTAVSLAPYQHNSGGLGILPYASEDVALSSKIAAADPDGVDRGLLTNYFWTVTDDPKSSREESIQALAGLAALGQPVIERLHSLSALPDLAWRESLALIRGLDAIGDREAARGLLDGLLAKAEEHDGLMTIDVSQTPAENIEATAEAAAIAASLANPAAAKLEAYVESNWQGEVLTDLDRAIYLQKTVPTLMPIQASLSYAVGEDVKMLDFKDQASYVVRLTSEEAKAFRVTSVDGPVVASFLKTSAGTTAAHDASIAISREYQKDGKPANDLHEGDLVTVVLTARWDAKAQDGCYALRDRLPAAFMPVVNIGYNRYQEQPLYYPYDLRPGEVSFVACKQDEPLTIRYLARVSSLGSYLAEGAALQSMVAPSIVTQSGGQVLEIK